MKQKEFKKCKSSHIGLTRYKNEQTGFQAFDRLSERKKAELFFLRKVFSKEEK